MTYLQCCRIAMALLVSCSAVSPVFAHQPHDPVSAVGVSPSFETDGTMIADMDYLTISIGVNLPLLSTDGGASFIPMSGLPNLRVTRVRFSPGFSSDGTIFLCGQGGLFRSTNRGLTWAQVASLPSPVYDVALSPDFRQDGVAFAITDTTAYSSSNHGGSFATLPTPALTGTLNSLGISPNFTADRTIALGGTSDGIFKSTDAGRSWVSSVSGSVCPHVQEIQFSPLFATDKTVFAASSGSGFFISKDGATTWNAANSGLTDSNANSIAIYPGFSSSSNTIAIATAHSGVFISASLGQSWTRAAVPPRALSPQTENHYRNIVAVLGPNGTPELFLGTFEGLWSSSTTGRTWDYHDSIPTSVIRNIALSPDFAADRVLLATTYGGDVILTGDAGTTWTLPEANFSNSYPDPVGIPPGYDQNKRLYAGHYSGLDHSTDDGASWSLTLAAGAKAYVRAIAISPAFGADTTMLFGVSNGEGSNPKTITYKGKTYPNLGVFLSHDAGWTWIPTSLGNSSVFWLAFSPGFQDDQIAFAGTTQAGAYRTTDGGLTWTQVLLVPGDPLIGHIAVSPNFTKDGTVFAATGFNGLYNSSDFGVTWNQIPGTVPFTATSLAISPNFTSDRTLFVGTLQEGLLESNDGGQSFHPTGLTGNLVTALGISPNYAVDHTIFAGTYQGMFASTDAARTFQFLNEPNREEDNRGLTVLYTGAWTLVNDDNASDATYSSTTTANDKVTINFVGSGIRWVGLRTPASGYAAVSFDGTPHGNVNLNSPTTLYRQTLYRVGGMTCGPHTLVITAAKPSNSQTGINIDAVDILRDTCNLR